MNQPDFWSTFGPLFAVNIFVLSSFAFFSLVIARGRKKNQEIENRHSSVILNKHLREFWFWLTHPIFSFFIKFRISPNAISIMGTIGAAISGVCFIYGKIGLGGWIMVLGASFDLFDGRVARTLNKETLAGSYIDSCMDRISEGLTLIGVTYMYLESPIFWVVMLVSLASQLTSYTKAKGETMGVDYSGGMMQRPERIAYLGAGAILTPMIAYLIHPYVLKYDPNLTHTQLEMWVYAIPLGFVAFFATLASYNRIINIMKLLDKKQFGSDKT